MPDQPKRLYRSQSNKVIAGVCGGIAEYLGVDPTVVRIAWVLLSILPLIPGIILYVIAWIIIPVNPTGVLGQTGKSPTALGMILGVLLIVGGGVLLLENLEIIDWWKWWDTFWDFAIPALLIATGVFFLMRPRSTGLEAEATSAVSAVSAGQEQSKRPALRRSLSDRKFFGVCGGLAAYFRIDTSIVRIAFIFFSIWPFGLGAVLYLILLLIMPEEPTTHPQPS